MIISSLGAAYLSGPAAAFPAGVLLAILGSASVVLASEGIFRLLSNVLTAVFYSAVFAYGWLIGRGPSVPPFEWLAAIAVVSFLVQLVLEEEVYVRL